MQTRPEILRTHVQAMTYVVVCARHVSVERNHIGIASLHG